MRELKKNQFGTYSNNLTIAVYRMVLVDRFLAIIYKQLEICLDGFELVICP
jgi:hypothetical protein